MDSGAGAPPPLRFSDAVYWTQAWWPALLLLPLALLGLLALLGGLVGHRLFGGLFGDLLSSLLGRCFLRDFLGRFLGYLFGRSLLGGSGLLGGLFGRHRPGLHGRRHGGRRGNRHRSGGDDYFLFFIAEIVFHVDRGFFFVIVELVAHRKSNLVHQSASLLYLTLSVLSITAGKSCCVGGRPSLRGFGTRYRRRTSCRNQILEY